jgi:hypothetical protein
MEEVYIKVQILIILFKYCIEPEKDSPHLSPNRYYTLKKHIIPFEKLVKFFKKMVGQDIGI